MKTSRVSKNKFKTKKAIHVYIYKYTRTTAAQQLQYLFVVHFYVMLTPPVDIEQHSACYTYYTQTQETTSSSATDDQSQTNIANTLVSLSSRVKIESHRQRSKYGNYFSVSGNNLDATKLQCCRCWRCGRSRLRTADNDSWWRWCGDESCVISHALSLPAYTSLFDSTTILALYSSQYWYYINISYMYERQEIY